MTTFPLIRIRSVGITDKQPYLVWKETGWGPEAPGNWQQYPLEISDCGDWWQIAPPSRLLVGDQFKVVVSCATEIDAENIIRRRESERVVTHPRVDQARVFDYDEQHHTLWFLVDDGAYPVINPGMWNRNNVLFVPNPA